MLTRDWSIVTKIAPELSQVVHLIEKFLTEIPTLRHVEPGRLIRWYGLGPQTAQELYLALEIARDRKLVKRSFGMIAPTTKCHAQGYWDRISRIPKVLYDTADDRFRRCDGTLILVYRDPEEPDGE
jgi:hypothetical protein